jgi:hypothetical protein
MLAGAGAVVQASVEINKVADDYSRRRRSGRGQAPQVGRVLIPMLGSFFSAPSLHLLQLCTCCCSAEARFPRIACILWEILRAVERRPVQSWPRPAGSTPCSVPCACTRILHVLFTLNDKYHWRSAGS